MSIGIVIIVLVLIVNVLVLIVNVPVIDLLSSILDSCSCDYIFLVRFLLSGMRTEEEVVDLVTGAGIDMVTEAGIDLVTGVVIDMVTEAGIDLAVVLGAETDMAVIGVETGTAVIGVETGMAVIGVETGTGVIGVETGTGVIGVVEGDMVETDMGVTEGDRGSTAATLSGATPTKALVSPPASWSVRLPRRGQSICSIQSVNSQLWRQGRVRGDQIV